MVREVRTEGNFDTVANTVNSGLFCADPSLAVQSQKEEADINTIVKNFGVTGMVPTNVRAPVFGDFTDIEDYQTAIEAIRAAEESFLKMPADVRKRFENDPQAFVEFCSDERNAEEMKKLGLTLHPVVQEPASPAVPAAVPPVG